MRQMLLPGDMIRARTPGYIAKRLRRTNRSDSPEKDRRMADRLECSDEKSLHNVANRRDGHTIVPFSTSKKEIAGDK
jgi:hypothetical protein